MVKEAIKKAPPMPEPQTFLWEEVILLECRSVMEGGLQTTRVFF